MGGGGGVGGGGEVGGGGGQGDILCVYFLLTIAIHVAEWKPFFFLHLGQQCLFVQKEQKYKKLFNIEHAGIGFAFSLDMRCPLHVSFSVESGLLHTD